MTMSDRICIMNGGRIDNRDSEEIYDQPRSLRRRVHGRHELRYGVALAVDGARRASTRPSGHRCVRADGVSAGEPVAASVRPEDIRLVPATHLRSP